MEKNSVRKTGASIRLRQHIDATGLKFGEAAQNFRCKREDMGQTIRLGAPDDDGERKHFGFVLLRQILIHGHEHVKLSRGDDQAKKFAVADAGPASLRNGFYLVAGKLPGQVFGQTLVEEKSHSGGLLDFLQHRFSGLLQIGDGLFAGNGGILFQKFIQ